MTTDLRDLELALQSYFDGLHEGDTAKLASVFHEEAHLFSVTDGKLDDMPRARWFEMVKNRPSARSRDLPRRDWVVSIDRSGPATAFAKSTVPDTTALFHGLSDIGEAGARMANHIENVSYWYTRKLIAQVDIVLALSRAGHIKGSGLWPRQRFSRAPGENH